MKQEKTSTPPNARWRGSARLSTMLTAVVTAMTVLCFTGCASSRKSVSRETSTSHEVSHLAVDSTVSVEETWQTPVKVPMSAVSLTLNLDSLRLLPQGAGYTARQGQASVKVSRKAPTADEPERIVIEAGCDSLELVCARYAKTINTLKRQLKIASDSKAEHKEEAKESTGNGFLMRLKYFLAGLLAGVIGIVYTFIKLKKK